MNELLNFILERKKMMELLDSSPYALIDDIINKVKDLNIIGKTYVPFDNSWCINRNTGEKASIVQEVDECYHPDEEYPTSFEVVSEPYVESVCFLSEIEFLTFIDIKSHRTGNVYRTLYSNKAVFPKRK